MIALKSTFIATAVCAVIVFDCPQSMAEQRHKKQQTEQTRTGPSRAKTEETADHIRAVSCDPSGSYAGYPDWARAALSCGKR